MSALLTSRVAIADTIVIPPPLHSHCLLVYMLSIQWVHVRPLEANTTLYHSVVGQILAINEEENPKVITLETPRGDIVYLRYGSDVLGTTPVLGGVYTISYQVDAGILRVVEIRKPEPGQYKAEFQRSSDFQRGADIEAPYRSRSASSIDPIFERRPSGTTPDDYAPTTSVLEGVRPDGITLIVVMLFLIGSFGTFVGLFMGIFIPFLGYIVLGLGGTALILAIGLWTYRDWARIGVIILSGLICLTIIGAIAGVPIIWYLEQGRIKKMFVY